MLKRWNFLKTGFYEGINHRSMQGEMMSILEDAAKLRKYTVAELAAEAKRLGLKPVTTLFA